jgi:hypothetical protein
MIITYDSTHTVAVTKSDDTLYMVRMFNLESYQNEFSEKVGGSENSYIKMKDIEQNSNGSKFALAFIDDGIFKIRTFEKSKVCKAGNGEEGRTEAEIKDSEFVINDKIDINHFTIPISNFPEPFITCTFINDDNLYVNLFYNYDQDHHHFIYNIPGKTISCHKKIHMDCTRLNFPYKCFWDSNQNQVYSFYRQGQSFRVPIDLETMKIDEDDIQ